MVVRLVKKEELDKVKWNSCVHYAINGNVFGYKWYMDSVSKEWDALVEGDYESVMPLFKTLKANTLQQPELIREAGIYSIHMLTRQRVAAFIDAIPETYKNFEIQLNGGIVIDPSSNLITETKKNYFLFLQQSYQLIREKYLEPLEIAIKDAHQFELKSANGLKPEKVAALFQSTTSKSIQSETQFHAYQRIMYNALHRGWGFASGIENAKGELLAAAFFIYSHSKSTLLLAPESVEGKAKGARFLLLDYFIRSHAERPMILDFNTSSAFPKEFNAEQINFQHVSRKSSRWKSFNAYFRSKG